MVFGVFNLVYGGLVLGDTVVIQGPDAMRIIGALVSFLAGAGLIAAGVLALVGRADYEAWRREQKARRRRRRD